MKFFLRWILPQVFFIPAYYIFIGGREVTWGLIGIYVLMNLLVTIGNVIQDIAKELD